MYDTPDLSVLSKWVLLAIDSIYDGNPQGIFVGIQTIASMTNLKQKEVKEALNELYEHQAIEVTLIDGDKFIKPLLYKTEYKKAGERMSIGDTPADTEQFDWDEISEKWAEYCPTLPVINRWTPQRKNKVRSVLKNARLTIQDLYKCFRIIGCTPFLNGTSNQFKATFDWCTSKSQNISKIYEGFYSKSYQEKRDYAMIMNNKVEVQNESPTDLFR